MQEDRALASSQLQEPIERRRSPVAAKMPEVVRSLPYLALQERSLPPNGSRLRAQRPPAQGGGAADKEARQRGNAILPYLRAPGSFKRLLGGTRLCATVQ